MAEHNLFGKIAEAKAVEFLQKQDYLIIETNWRYLKAEVDIIAKKGNELIFVEVKARHNNSVLSPEEAVNLKKKKLIIMAADFYTCNTEWNGEVRFDIISILKTNEKWNITHIPEAYNSIL